MKRAIMCAVAGLIVAGCNGDNEEAMTITTSPVERRTIVVDAQATGTVEPINVVEVKSKSSGQITQMPVEVGTLVEPGDLLVQLDARDVRSQYDQAVADVQAAEARLDVARSQQGRSEELFRQQIITSQEQEAAGLEFANANTQLVRSRASLDQAQQRLDDATVRAPVAGTVIEKPVSLGQVIASATGSASGGTTILKMANLNQVRVRALVNETDIGTVRPGQVARVTVDAYPDRPFMGTVEKIEPQAVVDQSVTMFPVLVSVSNVEGLLMPGMNGEVSMIVQTRNDVLAVPSDAVRNMREAPAIGAMLGLDAETVEAQLQSQFASARGGMAGGMQTRTAQGEVALVSNDAQDQPRRRQRAGSNVARGDSSAPASGAQAQQGTGDAARPMPAQGMNGAAPGRESAAGGRALRPGVVFVASDSGYVARVVRVGVSDFDYTEVVSGLEEGEQVARLASAALQAQRAQQNERIRGMTSLPGMSR